MRRPGGKVDSNSTEQTEQPETHRVGVLGHFNKYANLYVGVGVIAGVVLGIASFLGTNFGSGTSWPGSDLTERGWNSPPSKRMSVLALTKTPGVDFWSRDLRILPRHGRFRGKLRLENTGRLPLTGLVASAELGEPIVPVPDKCWHHSRPCRGSLFGGGIRLPDLQPGQWTTIVFSAEVPANILGSTYPVLVKVSSDQTGEENDTAEIVVSATTAEQVVWPFLEEVEETLALTGGSVKLAAQSRWLLLGQWPTFTLVHAHRFGQIKQFTYALRGRRLEVDDLNYERWLQGHVVRVEGKVAGRPIDEDVGNGVVAQMLELKSPGGETRLRCYIPRKQEDLFLKGDELEIMAIVVAWGAEGSANADLTVALCPAARRSRPIPQHLESPPGRHLSRIGTG
jgi:hypothetical protein